MVATEALTHHAGVDIWRKVRGDPSAESVYLWNIDKKGADRPVLACLLGLHFMGLMTEFKDLEVITVYEIDALGERHWGRQAVAGDGGLHQYCGALAFKALSMAGWRRQVCLQ